MAKAAFGEYAAFDTQGGIRFMKHSKLTSEKAIPSEVVAYLRKQLGDEPKQELPPQKFAPPTEEQKKQLREESLKTAPELQRDELSPEDFEENYQPEEPSVPKPEVEPRPSNDEIIGAEIIDKGITGTPVDPDFLESVSIHTASLQDMVEALYNRFGIYTVYLQKLPESDEINPLTAENFTKYHLGIAYQAAIYAQNKGLLDREPEVGRQRMDEGREAAKNWQVDQQPRTVGEARRANSFDYRTSPQGTRSEARTEIVHETDENGQVHAVQRDIPEGETGQYNGARARYDKDEDEPLVEPNFGGKPVIRPNW